MSKTTTPTGCVKCASRPPKNAQEPPGTLETPQTFKNGVVHVRVTCIACKSFVRWKPQDRPGGMPFTMPFGKHKGKQIELIPDSYLDWLMSQAFVKGSLKKRISDHLCSA